MSNVLSWEDFEKVDIRVGTIIRAEAFPEARKPAYKLYIDFGELGTRRSSAQITKFYSVDQLAGKQIIAVVNFPVKQIGKFFSECLVLGVYNEDKEVILLHPAQNVTNGMKIG